MMKTSSTWDQLLHVMDDMSNLADNDIRTIQIQLSAIENQVSTLYGRLDDVTRIQDDIKARISTLKEDVKDIAPRGEEQSIDDVKDTARGEARSEDDDF